MDSLVLSTGGTALAVSLLLQYLKKSSWFKIMGIEPQFEKINLFISVIAAGLSSLGIGYAYDGSSGRFMLIISLHQLWHWFIQWVSQHAAYKTFVVPVELLAAIVKELKAANTQEPRLTGDK